MSRRDATVISQPRGLSGVPLVGHASVAATTASWTASSVAESIVVRRVDRQKT